MDIIGIKAGVQRENAWGSIKWVRVQKSGGPKKLGRY